MTCTDSTSELKSLYVQSLTKFLSHERSRRKRMVESAHAILFAVRGEVRLHRRQGGKLQHLALTIMLYIELVASKITFSILSYLVYVCGVRCTQFT